MTDDRRSGGAAAPGAAGPQTPRRRPTPIRTRLVRSMLIAVGVAVLLLGMPLATVARQWIYSQELLALRENAQNVVIVLDRRIASTGLAAGVAGSAALLDAHVSVLREDGAVVRDSTGLAPGTRFDDGAVLDARSTLRRGAEIRGDRLIAAVGGDIAGQPVVVRLETGTERAEARVGTALLVIVVLGGIALAVGAALATWRARQLARPLESVAESARRLGEGDFSHHGARADVLEIDRIAASLDVTAARLRAALERSASLSADASHQLRTPLTALRLNLEALETDLGDDSASLAAAEAEVDRLEATIAELLELADAGATADVIDLRALTFERLDAWRTLADAAGRAVRVTRTAAPPVRVRPAAVGQALQVLLDNALLHGHGDVTVWLEPVHRHGRGWVRVCVGDEGPGPSPDDLEGSAGRGLPLARALVEAEGGRLVFDRERGGRVCLLLPAVDQASLRPDDAAAAMPGDGSAAAVDGGRAAAVDDTAS